MTINNGNGKVEMLCDVNGTEAPVTFCKCATCVEARRIHRRKTAVLVSVGIDFTNNEGRHIHAANDVIAENLARRAIEPKLANGRAWRRMKRAEKRAAHSGPFNGIKGLKVG